MSYFPLAFLLGFFGSLHCAVMCGPLMLSLPLERQNYFAQVLQLISYQIGRTLVYTILGVIVGLIGNSISFFTNQETLSLIVGIVMILSTLLYISSSYFRFDVGFAPKITVPIAKLMGKIYGMPYWGLFAGMLNALIPCGMVYLALASALNAGTVSGSATFMLLFGLGTTPLMLGISMGGIYLKKYFHFNSAKMIPWFMFFIGILFILRASELGIPVLSPINHVTQKGHSTICE